MKWQFRSRKQFFFLLFFSLFNFSTIPHGFHKDTIIRCTKAHCKKTIFEMVELAGRNAFHSLMSYDTRQSWWRNWFFKNREKWVEKEAKAGGYSRIPYHCTLSFDAPLPAVVPPSNPPPSYTYTYKQVGS